MDNSTPCEVCGRKRAETEILVCHQDCWRSLEAERDAALRERDALTLDLEKEMGWHAQALRERDEARAGCDMWRENAHATVRNCAIQCRALRDCYGVFRDRGMADLADALLCDFPWLEAPNDPTP